MVLEGVRALEGDFKALVIMTSGHKSWAKIWALGCRVCGFG